MYSPSQLDGRWLWVYDNKNPIDPIFYLVKGGLYPKSLEDLQNTIGFRGLEA